ncbi:hypothetical protein TH66_16295 [Carbonactinospora thermoautotrophica]|uniref:Uncharacterized protein n=2 Tax=Carbonactinospora thermoautotrophica TaxID=1469144 RepID=A0A132MRL6_9ACTN|nr:hypothetical protein [Carbonactinospora thermoautotrophica]KWX00370.1 hypothetical protein TH66_16295 [Carbonactinospora thermoautotrophica]
MSTLLTSAAAPAADIRLFRRVLVLVFCAGFLAAALGIPVRATFGAHVAVDETQYVLSALSLSEDGNLDISDELAERRWRAFADVEPPTQTAALPGGAQVSPHDPLLPLLLAAPTGLGGWVAAKLTLSGLAGLLAALTLWVAVRRFALPLRLAATGVTLAAASAPLAVYGQQVYPELPAALVTLGGVAVLTAPVTAPPAGRPARRHLALLGACVTALPWLSVKYGAVAAALAALGCWRWWRAGDRRAVLVFAGGLALMGVVYEAVHLLIWGGFTAYASGDHFQRSGEFGVVGFHPDYLGRSLRLVGLFVDRGFGLAAWQPAWLLLLPALAALARSRPRGALVLALPLAVGWAVATWIALTMHGYWWPGRQTVVVLPLALLVILWWLARVGTRVRALALALGLAGVVTYGVLLAAGYRRAITWVTGFWHVPDPRYQLVRPLLPDYQDGGRFWPLHLAWIGAFALLALAGWWSARPRVDGPLSSGSGPTAPAGASARSVMSQEGTRS